MAQQQMRYRVMTDRQIKDACDLRGVSFDDGNRVVFEVIPQAFGCRLRRYYRLRSPLGSLYGRWELEPRPRVSVFPCNEK